MSANLRIAVADDEPDMRQYFEKMLTHMGHEVISVAETGLQLLENCRTNRPDLVISDIKMPDMDGIEASAALSKENPLPIILVSGYHDPQLIARVEADHVLAYLVKPIKRADLETAIAIAMRRFHQFQTLRQEASDLRQALEDRKLIERAKGLLMKKVGIDEQDAFRRLQKLASDNNQKLVEIAKMIVTASQAFDMAVNQDDELAR